MRPQRRKRQRFGTRENEGPLKCAGHLQWVRGHECCLTGKWRIVRDNSGAPFTQDHVCEGRMEAHHSTTRGAGGGDDVAVPLCTKAHMEGHKIGWTTFEKRWGVDLAKISAELWKASPHRIKWERAHQVCTPLEETHPSGSLNT